MGHVYLLVWPIVYVHLIISPTAPPIIAPLNTTNPTAISDRHDGTVIIADRGSDVVVQVLVSSDRACPEAVWAYNGLELSNTSNYLVSNPCDILKTSYVFTLTIFDITSEKSGKYSAEFSNTGGVSVLPSLLVTVPSTLCHT